MINCIKIIAKTPFLNNKSYIKEVLEKKNSYFH